MDVLCLLHDSDEYGVLRWPLKDIIQATGIKPKLMRELVDKGVLKGADKGAEPYIYAPKHAGKQGDPVELLNPNDGPCWYCSRFVRDEYVRQRRGAATRFDSQNQPPKNTPTTALINPPTRPVGEPQGYGALSLSSRSNRASVPSERADEPPADPVWHTGLAFLIRKGISEKPARSLIGQLRKAVGDITTGALLADAETQDITDPAPWLMKAAASRADKGGTHAKRTQGRESLVDHAAKRAAAIFGAGGPDDVRPVD